MRSSTFFLLLSLLLASFAFFATEVSASRSQPHLNNYVSHRLHNRVLAVKKFAASHAQTFTDDLQAARAHVSQAAAAAAEKAPQQQRGKRLFAQELGVAFDTAKARAASPLSHARRITTGISDVGIIVLCVVLGFFFLLFLGFGTRYYFGHYAYGASPTTIVQTQPNVVAAQPTVVAQPAVVAAQPAVVTRPSAVVV